jgi:hypothetical protein
VGSGRGCSIKSGLAISPRFTMHSLSARSYLDFEAQNYTMRRQLSGN